MYNVFDLILLTKKYKGKCIILQQFEDKKL